MLVHEFNDTQNKQNESIYTNGQAHPSIVISINISHSNGGCNSVRMLRVLVGANRVYRELGPIKTKPMILDESAR